jgi:mitotic checkpoint serine/threonine-protein kinase BUB1 beta
MEQYSNDDRFVGVCAKYADKTKDPGQVFKYLHQQKVGTCTALFWIAWAFVAEKSNDFPFAEQIFKKGITKNAQPLQMLKMRHNQFQRRMSRHWLNQSKTNDRLEDEYEDETPNHSRATLGGLSRDRLRRNDRGRQTRQPQSSRPRGIASGLIDNTNRQSTQQSNGATSFSVYVEQEGENGYLDQSFAETDRRVIARDAERKKENTLEAERWNQRGGLRSRAKMSSAKETVASFSVFVDEECAAQHRREEEEEQRHLDQQRWARDDRTLREHGSEGIVSSELICF